jgi:hypothetical protein
MANVSCAKLMCLQGVSALVNVVLKISCAAENAATENEAVEKL